MAKRLPGCNLPWRWRVLRFPLIVTHSDSKDVKSSKEMSKQIKLLYTTASPPCLPGVLRQFKQELEFEDSVRGAKSPTISQIC